MVIDGRSARRFGSDILVEPEDLFGPDKSFDKLEPIFPACIFTLYVGVRPDDSGGNRDRLLSQATRRQSNLFLLLLHVPHDRDLDASIV